MKPSDKETTPGRTAFNPIHWHSMLFWMLALTITYLMVYAVLGLGAEALKPPGVEFDPTFLKRFWGPVAFFGAGAGFKNLIAKKPERWVVGGACFGALIGATMLAFCLYVKLTDTQYPYFFFGFMTALSFTEAFVAGGAFQYVKNRFDKGPRAHHLLSMRLGQMFGSMAAVALFLLPIPESWDAGSLYHLVMPALTITLAAIVIPWWLLLRSKTDTDREAKGIAKQRDAVAPKAEQKNTGRPGSRLPAFLFGKAFLYILLAMASAALFTTMVFALPYLHTTEDLFLGWPGPLASMNVVQIALAGNSMMGAAALAVLLILGLHMPVERWYSQIPDYQNWMIWLMFGSAVLWGGAAFTKNIHGCLFAAVAIGAFSMANLGCNDIRMALQLASPGRKESTKQRGGMITYVSYAKWGNVAGAVLVYLVSRSVSGMADGLPLWVATVFVPLVLVAGAGAAVYVFHQTRHPGRDGSPRVRP